MDVFSLNIKIFDDDLIVSYITSTTLCYSSITCDLESLLTLVRDSVSNVNFPSWGRCPVLRSHNCTCLCCFFSLHRDNSFLRSVILPCHTFVLTCKWLFYQEIAVIINITTYYVLTECVGELSLLNIISCPQ